MHCRLLSRAVYAAFLIAVCAIARPLPAAIDPEAAFPQIIEALRDAASLQDLDAKLVAIKEQGASAQQLAEIKLIYLLFRSADPAEYLTIADEVQALKPTWKVEESFQSFPNARAIDAFDAYVRALIARDKGDAAGFEQHAKTALFLSAGTEVAQKYSEAVVEFFQLQTPVAMDTMLLTDAGEKQSLAEIARGQKAVYVQVWATWCGPCIATFPALKSRATELAKQGVPVVALNSELGRDDRSGGFQEKAAALRKQHQMEGVDWYLETQDAPFTTAMTVDSVPRAIVFTPEGRVLFNGHPLDPRLERVFAGLDVKLDVMAGLDVTMTAAAAAEATGSAAP